MSFSVFTVDPYIQLMHSDLLTTAVHIRFIHVLSFIFVTLALQVWRFWKPLFSSLCVFVATGSYKEHEHNGCKFCETVRCCKPSDSKHCCPCAWHQLERVKQANAVEDSIRKQEWPENLAAFPCVCVQGEHLDSAFFPFAFSS